MVLDLGTPTQEARYIAAAEALERETASQAPSWLSELRRGALGRFKALGFPVARRGNEEWKYTDIGPLARAPLHPLSDGLAQSEPAQGIPFTFSAAWDRLVFLGDRFQPGLSGASILHSGVVAGSLAQSLGEHEGLAQQHLAGYADYQEQAFTALNTALLHDGAFVYVPDGVVVKLPVHLLFLATPSPESTASHPRTLVVVGQEAQVTLIEDYAGLKDGPYFTNAVSEIVVGPGAVVRYHRLQRQSEAAFHVHTAQVALDRDSAFYSTTVDVGGGLVRNNLNVVFQGPRGFCQANGLYLGTRSQHIDNQVLLDHAQPFTASRELYKGVLGGEAKGVFHGGITVRRGAKKVEARQEDKNLLLSDQAAAYSKPAFWIYADDVKCSHGAACGKLDDQAFFYLRSRGLSEDEARNLLVQGFIREVLEAVQEEAMRAHLEKLVLARLQDF